VAPPLSLQCLDQDSNNCDDYRGRPSSSLSLGGRPCFSISPPRALQKRKARDSNPHLPRGRAALAVRSGQPYPATFRIHRSSVDPPGVEPESPPCHSGVVPLDYEPVLRRQWTAGELNPDLLVATQMSCRWTSSPVFERSVRELNPIFRLTKAVCSRNTYRPLKTTAVSLHPRYRSAASLASTDGVEPSSPACRAGVVPLDHGIAMTEVGVEPTKSPGSRPGRFASLRTQSQVAGPGVAPVRRSL
jgi:hypothetical protein